MVLAAFLFCALGAHATRPEAYRCTEARVEPNKPIYFCNKDEDGPTLAEILTRATAALGVLLSVASFFYTRSKDKRARRLSVEDDFWLRGIIRPHAVDPMIKLVLETTGDLPQDCMAPGWDAEALRGFSLQYQIKHQQTVAAIYSLSLLDGDLCKSVLLQLDNIEDTVVRYCALNAGNYKGKGGGARISRVEAQIEIRNAMLMGLNAIKTFQAKSL